MSDSYDWAEAKRIAKAVLDNSSSFEVEDKIAFALLAARSEAVQAKDAKIKQLERELAEARGQHTPAADLELIDLKKQVIQLESALKEKEAAIDKHNKRMQLITTAKRPTNAVEAMRIVANWLDELYQDAGTGRDIVQQDLRKFADDVADLQDKLGAAYADNKALVMALPTVPHPGGKLINVVAHYADGSTQTTDGDVILAALKQHGSDEALQAIGEGDG